MHIFFAKAFFGSLFFLTLSGHSEEIVQQEKGPFAYQNVVVDSIPLSQEKRDFMEKIRYEEYENSKISEDPLRYSSAFERLSSMDPSAFSEHIHKIKSFKNASSFVLIKIEDDSKWAVDPNDLGILENWAKEDSIVITPKSQMYWGSNYQYILTNKDKNFSSVKANLYLGPIPFGKNSTWITKIDYHLGQLFLLDGQGNRSKWEVSNADMYLLKDWATSHVVIIGENDNWFWWFSDYKNIVINAQMDHYIRAKKISIIVNTKITRGL